MTTQPTKQPKQIKSKFVRVRCSKCGHEQIIFGKASTVVKCLECGRELARPGASKAKIKARVLEILK